jgi:hypothetical protein
MNTLTNFALLSIFRNIVQAGISASGIFAVLSSFLATCAITAASNGPQPDPETVAKVKAVVARSLDHGQRYMEGERVTVDSQFPRWEGFPVTHYRYSVYDKVNHIKRTSEVLLLDPTDDQLAVWIASALLEVKHVVNDRDTASIVAELRDDSGGQFPIAGVVYEDMSSDNRDAPQEIYCFRDGVTVSIAGLTNGEAAQVTDSMLKKALDPSTPIVRSGKYARFVNTQRQDYVAYTHKSYPDAVRFVDLSRTLYQEAWKGNRNAMMVFWVYSHLR